MIGPQDGLAAARSAADLVSTLALLSPGTVRAVLSRAEVEAAAGSYLRVALEGLEKDAAEGLGKDAAEGLGSAVSGGAAGGADADADAEGPGKAAAAAAAAARARRGAGALRDVAAAWGALTALHDCLHPTPMTCDDPSWAAHPPQPTPAAPAVVTRLYTAFAAGAAAAGASLRAAAGTAAWGAVLTLSLEGASSLLHAALRACCRRFQPIPVPSTRRVTRCPRLIHTPHTHPSPIQPIHTLTHAPSTHKPSPTSLIHTTHPYISPTHLINTPHPHPYTTPTPSPTPPQVPLAGRSCPRCPGPRRPRRPPPRQSGCLHVGRRSYRCRGGGGGSGPSDGDGAGAGGAGTRVGGGRRRRGASRHIGGAEPFYWNCPEPFYWPFFELFYCFRALLRSLFCLPRLDAPNLLCPAWMCPLLISSRLPPSPCLEIASPRRIQALLLTLAPHLPAALSLVMGSGERARAHGALGEGEGRARAQAQSAQGTQRTQGAEEMPGTQGAQGAGALDLAGDRLVGAALQFTAAVLRCDEYVARCHAAAAAAAAAASAATAANVAAASAATAADDGRPAAAAAAAEALAPPVVVCVDARASSLLQALGARPSPAWAVGRPWAVLFQPPAGGDAGVGAGTDHADTFVATAVDAVAAVPATADAGAGAGAAAGAGAGTGAGAGAGAGAMWPAFAQLVAQVRR